MKQEDVESFIGVLWAGIAVLTMAADLHVGFTAASLLMSGIWIGLARNTLIQGLADVKKTD